MIPYVCIKKEMDKMRVEKKQMLSQIQEIKLLSTAVLSSMGLAVGAFLRDSQTMSFESHWTRSAGQITRRVGAIYPATVQIDTPFMIWLPISLFA